MSSGHKPLGRTVVVSNPHGLHLRVASRIAQLVRDGQCRATLSCKGCAHADGCSVMQMLALGVTSGQVVTISATGPDASEMVSQIAEVLTEGAGI